MSDYRKIALVVLRAIACYMIFDALRELASVVIYVPATYFYLLPAFTFNVYFFAFAGCINLVGGLFFFAVSRPLANRIAEHVGEDEGQP